MSNGLEFHIVEGRLRYYDQLGKNNRALYRMMEERVNRWENLLFIDSSGKEPKEIMRMAFMILNCVLQDHPEVFWIGERLKVRCKMRNGVYYVSVGFDYLYGPEESRQLTAQIEQKTEEVFSAMPFARN